MDDLKAILKMHRACCLHARTIYEYLLQECHELDGLCTLVPPQTNNNFNFRLEFILPKEFVRKKGRYGIRLVRVSPSRRMRQLWRESFHHRYCASQDRSRRQPRQRTNRSEQVL